MRERRVRRERKTVIPASSILQCPFLRPDTRHHIIFPRPGSRAFQHLLLLPSPLVLTAALAAAARGSAVAKAETEEEDGPPNAAGSPVWVHACGDTGTREGRHYRVSLSGCELSKSAVPVSVWPPFSADHLSSSTLPTSNPCHISRGSRRNFAALAFR